MILYLHLQYTLFLVIILLLSFNPCHPSIDWSTNALIAICNVLKWRFQVKRTKYWYSRLGSLLHLLSAVFATTSIVLHVQPERTSTVMFLSGASDTSKGIFEHNFWHFLPTCSRLLSQFLFWNKVSSFFIYMLEVSKSNFQDQVKWDSILKYIKMHLSLSNSMIRFLYTPLDCMVNRYPFDLFTYETQNPDSIILS